MFSVRLSPDGALAVTGGEDDKAFVWKTVDCSILFVCNGTCLYCKYLMVCIVYYKGALLIY